MTHIAIKPNERFGYGYGYVAYARCQLVANWQRLTALYNWAYACFGFCNNIFFHIERQRHEAAPRAQRPQLSLLLNVTYNDMFI